MKNLKSEVLVIGSGFGASPMAMRLAEAGIQVTMIEKGPAIDPYKDFRQTQNPKYLLKYLKVLHGEGASLNYVEGEGGGSGFYEMMSLRAPSEVFSKKDSNGKSVWPQLLNRKTMDPYYNIVESMLNIHQIPEEEVPKNGQLFAQMMKNMGYSADRINYAVKGCLQCGRCVTGCIYGAKQSLLLTYLPRAKSAGMQFLANTSAINIRQADHIKPVSKRSTSMENMPYRYTVICRNNEEEEFEIMCKYLVLGAGTIGTAKILLQSRAQLPQLSRHVGQNISFNGSVKMAVLLPEQFPDGDLFTGRSHPGVMSFEFLKSHGIVITTAKPLPLQIFGAARISKFSDGEFGFMGADHISLMEKMRHRMMFLIAFGDLPADAAITLEDDDTLNFKKSINGVEKQFYKEGKSLLERVANGNGAEILNLKLMGKDGLPHEKLHFASAHHLGSCKMSERVEDGVVNAEGEVHGYPGMYISDGSVFPSSLIIGPSLSIAANAERIAHTLLKNLNLSTPATDQIDQKAKSALDEASI